MLILALVALALLAVPLTRGRWSNLARVRLHRVWLLWAALGVQLLVLQTDALGHGASAALHLASYALAAVFVWSNRRPAGVLLVGLGGLANGLTITLNGGTLPASAAALARAGLPVHRTDFVNSGVVDHPRLAFLGDMFAWPTPLPLANVFSVGDVLIVAGSAWALHVLARRCPQPAGAAAEPCETLAG